PDSCALLLTHSAERNVVNPLANRLHRFYVFHGSGDHRPQHSFPTRRSSDLSPLTAASFPEKRLMRSATVFKYWRLVRRINSTRGDRKSTRLNSSHDQISYAVFCLKKKTERRSLRRPTARD